MKFVRTLLLALSLIVPACCILMGANEDAALSIPTFYHSGTRCPSCTVPDDCTTMSGVRCLCIENQQIAFKESRCVIALFRPMNPISH